ncbi:MAG TPA: Phenylacetic acid catabolic protein, partial [Longimicrobiaceae bacterium]|nr:Phenylacetic acid catabolic protein [Longimicrobiaceae bacterium]
MKAEATARTDEVDSAAELSEGARAALRDLLLTLADNKRLLGIRYSDWMLGAPTLETGIAASSMAQDEWGHARLTYALLSDFGDDPKQLEHDRGAEEYRNLEILDAPFSSWAEMLAAALLIDTALTMQYGALVESRYVPVHNRVQKLLDEESYHFQYAAGWAHRLAGTEAKEELQQSLARLLPVALRWLAGADEDATNRLRDEGLVREGADEMRARFLHSVAPVLTEAGLAEEVGLHP